MSSLRRWYFYVVSAIALQAVTWAVIALLRNLLNLAFNLVEESAEIQTIAFQISVIIIGLPMFLLHWRWAERAVDSNLDEPQENTDRYIYLYFMLGAFLIPLLTNINGFLRSLLRLAGGVPAVREVYSGMLPDGANLVYTFTAVFVLSLMLLYHSRLLRAQRNAQAITPTTAALHRLFIYLFAAVGLFSSATFAAELIQALLLSFSDRTGLAISRRIIDAIAGLLTMAPLWLAFWNRAQALYHSGEALEERSLLRKFYLYAVIFISVLTTVSALTAVLAGFLRRLLGLEPFGGSGAVAGALIVGLSVWAYHALILREDTQQTPVPAEVAGLRRLYRYLVAGVGLLALLVGLAGVLGVLFQPGDFIVSRQREQLAWFAAMAISGLFVWIVPWYRVQQETDQSSPTAVAARTSAVRRFYLFFFLLLATLTFLVSAVYILSRFLTTFLGQPLLPEETRTMGLAGAYALIAAAVWLYHGRLYRKDRAVIETTQEARAAAARIIVVDDGGGELGIMLLDALRAALPNSHILAVALAADAAEAMNAVTEESIDQVLETADIIVGPWSMATAHAGLSADEHVQAAIAASRARKLILPRPAPGWEWTGIKSWQPETAVRDAAEQVTTIVAGETAAARAINSPATIAFLIAATIIILILIFSLLESVIPVF